MIDCAVSTTVVCGSFCSMTSPNRLATTSSTAQATFAASSPAARIACVHGSRTGYPSKVRVEVGGGDGGAQPATPRSARPTAAAHAALPRVRIDTVPWCLTHTGGHDEHTGPRHPDA